MEKHPTEQVSKQLALPKAVSQKAAQDQSVVSSVVKAASAEVKMVEDEGKNGNGQSVVGGEVSQEDPIVEELGHPFLADDKGRVHLNERAVAVKCATVQKVKGSN